jgi:hypothetical protein
MCPLDMSRRISAFLTMSAILFAAGCGGHAPPSAPPTCCAAPGYSRALVESVVGRPAPPESSKFNPYPSPPKNGQIYPTEHGFLTVTYSAPQGVADHLTLDFYEGKAPDDAFSFASAFVPPDARDTGTRVSGKRESIRVYQSATLSKRLPASRGMIYLECSGADPTRLCMTVDIAVGAP